MGTYAEWGTTHEYKDDEFEIECPNCKKINIVSVYKQEGNIEPEECYCANCGCELGKIHASNTPRTRIKN